MSYDVFKEKIKAIIRRSMPGMTVSFSSDEEIGKHYAKLADGTLITGYPSSLKVTVNWGSSHVSMATI